LFSIFSSLKLNYYRTFLLLSGIGIVCTLFLLFSKYNSFQSLKISNLIVDEKNQYEISMKNSKFNIFLKDGSKCIVNSDKSFFYKDSGIVRLENLRGSVLTKNGAINICSPLALLKIEKKILYFPKSVEAKGCGKKKFHLKAAAAIYNSKSGLIKGKEIKIKSEDGLLTTGKTGIIDVATQRVELKNAKTVFSKH
jgi:hypothetical protein